MKYFLVVLATAASIMFGTQNAVHASSLSPVFGKAKVSTLDKTKMKSVVGQGATSAYYAYLGNYYGTIATQYGAYGAYLEALGSAYTSARYTNYFNAYSYAYSSYINYYYAWYYN